MFCRQVSALHWLAQKLVISPDKNWRSPKVHLPGLGQRQGLTHAAGEELQRNLLLLRGAAGLDGQAGNTQQSAEGPWQVYQGLSHHSMP